MQALIQLYWVASVAGEMLFGAEMLVFALPVFAAFLVGRFLLLRRGLAHA